MESSFRFNNSGINLKNCILFTSLQELPKIMLAQALIYLREEMNHRDLEEALTKREYVRFKTIDETIAAIMTDVAKDQQRLHLEFSNLELSVHYYMGRNVRYTKSVEIIQLVYTEQSYDDPLYFSLVVKYKQENFLYWPW